MNSIDDFVVLVRDETGLEVTSENVHAVFDEVPGWNSLHLLTLLTLLERATGRTLSLPDVLEAPSLAHVYELAVPR